MNTTSAENYDISWVSSADQQRWDDYVVNSALTTPYHRFAWLQAVESAYGYTQQSVIATEKATGHVVGILPLVYIDAFFISRQLCSLPFCDIGAAIADSAVIDELMHAFALSANQQVKAQFLEIRRSLPATDNEAELTGQKVRMIMPLEPGSETLLASFKSKLRSQIKKAEKNGLTVKLGNSAQLIADFYSVYTVNMRDLGSPPHAEDWFMALQQAYADDLIVSVVYHNAMPIGAGIVLRNGPSACIPWASTIQLYNRLAPNMLLYWSLLAHCADTGIQWFDFGRSTYGEGTYRFKKQWGAVPQPLRWYRQFPSGDITDLNETTTPGTSKKRQMLEDTWRRLPLPLTIKFGAAIRPYITL